MTRHLDLTQRQVRAICEGAKKAGYAPIIQVGNMLVRLVPEDHAIHAQDERRIDTEKGDDLDAELAAFEAKHGNG